MTKQRIDIENVFHIVLYGVLLFVGIMFFSMANSNIELKVEKNAALNAYADLWCQKQTYDVVLVESYKDFNETLCPDENFSEEIHYLNRIESALADRDIYFITNGDKSYFIDFLPDGKTIIDTIHYNYTKCTSQVLEQVETRHYTTGRYLPNENKIECFGEPEEDLSDGVFEHREPWDISYYLPPDAPIKTKIIYQKSQKFEVPI